MSKKQLRLLKEQQLLLQNQLLKKQLEPDRNSGWFDRTINEPLKKYSTLLLTVLSIVGGIWGVYLPIKTFLHEQQMSTQYNLNRDIIELIQELDSAKESDKTISILTYYERDAVPLLIYELGRRKEAQKQPIVNALKTIINLTRENDASYLAKFFGEKGVRSMIIDQLLGQTRYHFQRYYRKPIEPNDNRLDGMLNYLYCLREFGENREDLESFLNEEFLKPFERDSILNLQSDPRLELDISIDDKDLIRTEIKKAIAKW